MNPILQRVLPVLCLLGLASAARAEELASFLRDEAGLFQADALDRAEKQIAEMSRTFHRDLFVYTVKSAPIGERKWLRFLRTRQVNRILEEQAEKRARESGADGIFVVICNDPKDVHIVVRPVDDSMFTPHDRETLRRTVARRLQDSGPDQALLGLVQQVRTMLQANATRGQSTSVVSERVLAGLVGGMLGLWLVLCLVRYKMRPRRPVSETTSTERGRRTASLLGAMFGFAAGQWMYDKLYPSPTTAAETVPELEAPAVPEKDGADQPAAESHPEDAPVQA